MRVAQKRISEKLGALPQVKHQCLGCAEWKIATVREDPIRGRFNFDDPARVRDFWVEVISRCQWYHEDKEHLVCICLDTKHNIKGFSLISIGSLNESIAHPREIFRPAVVAAAYCIIIAHNHPSGNPTPSMTDIDLSRRLWAAGDLLQIPLLDHVIVSDRPAAPASEGRSFRSLRPLFDAWRTPGENRQEPVKKKRKSLVVVGAASKVTKPDPLAAVSADRKIMIQLNAAQLNAMKGGDTFGSMKIFIDKASAFQLERLRTADPVLFTTRGVKSCLLAVRNLQPHETPSSLESIKFSRALIDTALARLSVDRCKGSQTGTA